MLDLAKYGLTDEWKKLDVMQSEVGFLEQRRAQAERELQAASQGMEAARQQDAEAAAKAIRAGKDVPPPKNEKKAQGRVETAQRSLAAFERAVSDARADLGQYQAAHRDELREAITDALLKQAHDLAQHAREATRLFGVLEDSKYTLRGLQPEETAEGPSGPAKSSSYIMGVRTTASTDPPRGNVEATLSYLAGLESRFASVGEEQGGEDAA